MGGDFELEVDVFSFSALLESGTTFGSGETFGRAGESREVARGDDVDLEVVVPRGGASFAFLTST